MTVLLISFRHAARFTVARSLTGTTTWSVSHRWSSTTTAVAADPATTLATPDSTPAAAPTKPKKAPKAAIPPADPAAVDVTRVDMRVAHILAARIHENADSLYVETMDLGESSPRTVVSGLVKYISLADLINKHCVVVANLKPAKMRGIVSEAMVLCAEKEGKVELLVPPQGAMPGDRVMFESLEEGADTPDAVLNPKRKIWEAVQVGLKTDKDGVAGYVRAADGTFCAMKTAAGVVTAPTIVDGMIR
ncbi:methionine-tRNA ligase, beta subunit [Allomyces macrogynus ATCC 38327]|uniref:Methionine-tRNA ligase, beta subunit n=1 Tax=Allomyces macrogynus (strain ATCC 38327) TaxID=578462 RepID=A0A0L0S4C3_ALLM3|nr:methionine-tRNA ligase, beta subunit [Allomyces macrogynus ATCC 38327]|eukprot:KNE57403.1 methionine-tRNA ligase, beta subunit [Allomyces macrogynus ATCC 38327]